MKYFERELERIIGYDVTITSWWDTHDETWHALSPKFVSVAHDWRGVTGKSREEAIGNLVSFLADYLEQEQQMRPKANNKLANKALNPTSNSSVPYIVPRLGLCASGGG
jgi:predicted RNase H-like HicB family nuclease